jgi:acetyl-CoA carboxylase carboxyl transferase subunit alpha
MSQLKVPVICLVTGEGCSGGALGIGVGDSLLMLEYSTFSVISPEGCATILFKSAEKAKDAAEMMQMTAHKLKKLGLINDIVSEPLGGAHRSYEDASQNVRDALIKTLDGLSALSVEELLAKRYDRLMSLGSFKTS